MKPIHLPAVHPARRRLLAAAGSAAALPWLAACGGTRGSVTAPPPPAGALDAYPPMPEGAPQPASARARRAAAALAGGINFGNMLDAPREGDWGLRAEPRFIALVGDGGFTRGVRLPVRWSNHASVDAAATVDPAFFARVDAVLDALLARGATVLLNMHHYRQLDGDALDANEFAVDPALLEQRLLAIWRQVARRYAHHGERLVFELYNEPHGRLEPLWNGLLSRALRVVRDASPERVVVIGPTHWNSATHLPRLLLPSDPHLVLTVHHYEPFGFTHQGAEWVSPTPPLGQDCCDATQRAAITQPLDLAAADAARRGLPVLVGEWGAYAKAPRAARLRYTRLMRDEMAARALPWMYWELAAGFGVYDPATNRFDSELMEALYGR